LIYILTTEGYSVNLLPYYDAGKNQSTIENCVANSAG